MKPLLEQVYELQLEGKIKTREAALSWARRKMGRRAKPGGRSGVKGGKKAPAAGKKTPKAVRKRSK